MPATSTTPQVIQTVQADTWAITGWRLDHTAADPLGVLYVEWRSGLTQPDGSTLWQASVQETVLGEDLKAAMVDAEARVKDALGATPAPTPGLALYRGIKSALYALLQARGTVPSDAVVA